MSTKVDSASTEEPKHAHSPVSKSTLTNSTSSPKVSMLGVKSGYVIPKNKSGFVIPKNKLSGSLVPIVRGGGKVESDDAQEEDNSKQVQRNTKWGDDFTQDAAVRKGRSLAYQTRLEQITQLLKSGSLELGDDQDSQLPGQPSDVDSVDQSTGSKLHRHELLELERREVIGEILRLNPGYKAPPDYKPVLKEARIPIPLKAHPGNNFIGSILGPANTQKRLEEETGAKVRVYGIKLDTKEKCEITRSDATETQAVYEELFVHISADSYEKVDAAVALIELLVAPASAVPAVVSTTSSSVTGSVVLEQSQKDSASAQMSMPLGPVNQNMVQPTIVPAHSVMPQFQTYAGSWHPHGSPNVFAPPSAVFIHPPVSSSMQFNSPTNLLTAPFPGGHPQLGMVPRNVPGIVTRPEPSMQSFQQPLNQATVPWSHTNTIQQTPSAYPAMASPSTSVLPAVSPSISSGSMPAARPIHLAPQPSTSGGFPYNRPLSTPSGSSPGFSAGPLPLRPNNVMHMVPPSSTPLLRPQMLIPQNNVALPSQPSMPTPAVNGHPVANFAPRIPLQSSNVPSNLPSAPHGGQVPASAVVSLPTPAPMPTFLPSHAPSPSTRPFPGPVSALAQTTIGASVQNSVQVLPQSVPLSSIRGQASIATSLPALAQTTIGASVQNSVQVLPQSVPLSIRGQASIATSLPAPSHQHVPPGAAMASSPSFRPKPPLASPVGVPSLTSPKPQQPSFGDFTFQPHKTQVSASVTSSMPSPHPVPHTSSQVSVGAAQTPSYHNASQLPLAPPAPPSFRPAAAQSPPIPMGGISGASRPQNVGQMGPPRQVPLQSSSFSSASPFPGTPTNLLAAPPRSPAFLNTSAPPGPLVGLRNFAPAVATVSAPIPSRPAPLVQPQPPPGHQPHGLVAPSQHVAVSLPSFVPPRPASTPGGAQIYDPFSPTSIAAGPRRPEDDPAKARKPETDAEYEDLMASVGVR